MPKQISVVSFVKHTYRDEFVSNQLVEAQINPSLSPKMRNALIEVLYTYNNSFASANEPLSAIKGQQVDITLNIERAYPPVLRRPAYPASPKLEEPFWCARERAALHRVQIIDDKPIEIPVCYISREIKPREERYGASQMECLYLPCKNIAKHDYSSEKAGRLHKNADGLIRWALANTPDNPAYVPLQAEPQIPIEGINITDILTEFFEQVREYYKQDKNCHILTSLLDQDCKVTSLVNALNEIWNNSYSEGRFHFFDGIIYHRTKYSCVMTLCSRLVINTSLHECHDRIYSGYLSEDRTLEKVKNCAWWPPWRKETIEYCHTCDRCHKENRSTGKKFGLMIHIKEQKAP
ncbi:hypothetical protein O181_031139 [Austropuccinia psidii MF-1]|uniref:Integrase zinc-binding domain-containing protein n=1 Tax=Austropuccinia psidii MF-1 TaxID=1389203 RepID=A0A9Q3H684_9BASI|nr:hypothetical protein [Austropuccinia psidii MF-1]